MKDKVKALLKVPVWRHMDKDIESFAWENSRTYRLNWIMYESILVGFGARKVRKGWKFAWFWLNWSFSFRKWRVHKVIGNKAFGRCMEWWRIWGNNS